MWQQPHSRTPPIRSWQEPSRRPRPWTWPTPSGWGRLMPIWLGEHGGVCPPIVLPPHRRGSAAAVDAWVDAMVTHGATGGQGCLAGGAGRVRQPRGTPPLREAATWWLSASPLSGIGTQAPLHEGVQADPRRRLGPWGRPLRYQSCFLWVIEPRLAGSYPWAVHALLREDRGLRSDLPAVEDPSHLRLALEGGGGCEPWLGVPAASSLPHPAGLVGRWGTFTMPGTTLRSSWSCAITSPSGGGSRPPIWWILGCASDYRRSSSPRTAAWCASRASPRRARAS